MNVDNKMIVDDPSSISQVVSTASALLFVMYSQNAGVPWPNVNCDYPTETIDDKGAIILCILYTQPRTTCIVGHWRMRKTIDCKSYRLSCLIHLPDISD